MWRTYNFVRRTYFFGAQFDASTLGAMRHRPNHP